MDTNNKVMRGTRFQQPARRDHDRPLHDAGKDWKWSVFLAGDLPEHCLAVEINPRILAIECIQQQPEVGSRIEALGHHTARAEPDIAFQFVQPLRVGTLDLIVAQRSSHRRSIG